MAKKSGPESEPIEILAELSIDAMKEIAGKGQKLSSKTLTQAMLARPDIKNLLLETPEIKQLMKKNESQATEIDLLNEQAQMITSQKDQLLKQLQELEEQFSKTDNFFRKALVLFINLAREKEEKTLYPLLDRFKALVQNEPRLDMLFNIFAEIKNTTLREEPHGHETPQGRTPSSFLKRLFKGSKIEAFDEEQFPTIYIEHLKTAYHGIIEELRLNLGQKYLQKTTEISKLISQSDNFNELRAARKKMLSLIQEFINSINSERALSAEFIREISQRIMDIETLMLASFAYVDNTFEANEVFQTNLDKHMDALQNSVNFSKTLEALKDEVVSQLDLFAIAIADKKKQDRHVKTQMDKKLASFRQVVKLMKNKTFSAEKNAESLEQELLKDALTGIFNRRAYDQRAKSEMQRYLRYQTDFSVILFDIDHFKLINDQYGHATGDRCLKEIISRVKPIIRETDFLARYGGEEFIILLPETTGDNALIVSEKLKSVVENIEFLHKGDPIKITISAGVSQAKPGDSNYGNIFDRTDQALYQAKNTGRNRVVQL